MHFQTMRFPSSEWTMACDDELVQKVVARMRVRLGSQVRNFQISGCSDGLILRGQVRAYYGRQLAKEVAMEISGIPVVTNEVEVMSQTDMQAGTATAGQGCTK